jgi:hypothetical protein
LGGGVIFTEYIKQRKGDTHTNFSIRELAAVFRNLPKFRCRRHTGSKLTSKRQSGRSAINLSHQNSPSRDRALPTAIERRGAQVLLTEEDVRCHIDGQQQPLQWKVQGRRNAGRRAIVSESDCNCDRPWLNRRPEWPRPGWGCFRYRARFTLPS